jgi:hypothetical protein
MPPIAIVHEMSRPERRISVWNPPYRPGTDAERRSRFQWERWSRNAVEARQDQREWAGIEHMWSVQVVSTADVKKAMVLIALSGYRPWQMFEERLVNVGRL